MRTLTVPGLATGVAALSAGAVWDVDISKNQSHISARRAAPEVQSRGDIVTAHKASGTTTPCAKTTLAAKESGRQKRGSVWTHSPLDCLPDENDNRKDAPRMKFFADTADTAEIRELAETGLLDGVTTNPSLIAKSGRDFIEVVEEICAIVAGPVRAEGTALDSATMIAEGKKLAKIAKNIAVKVPLTWDGLKACKALTSEGTMVNVTLCFSANQALLAAKAGATFVSPFIGRLDDLNLDGMELIREIREIYDNYPMLKTEILAASIRNANHVKESALAGADVATVPPAVLKSLVTHPLTDKGIEMFMADWKKTGQKIL